MQLDQSQYWDDVADQKVFSHPLQQHFFDQMALSADASIVDLGCGYGRNLEQLHKMGFTRLTGLDFSEKMLSRAKVLVPEASFVHTSHNHIPLEANQADCVLIFAVLTCIPHNEDLQELIAEAKRILKPGSYIYLSDNLLNHDERNVRRYQAAEKDGLPYGSFRLPEGAICRHFKKEYLLSLFDDFSLVMENAFVVTTMNGNKANAVQFLLRK